MNTNWIWLLKLLVDFGLVVLVLMVQLIIYPSFIYYSREKLIEWHKIYAARIAAVVIPLMLSQVLLSLAVLSQDVNLFSVTNGLLVTGVWISTFTQFVPIHNRIGKNFFVKRDLDLLVKRNWVRVTLWTIIFLLTILRYQLSM